MRPHLAAASIVLLGLACATGQAKDADLPLPRGWHTVPLDRYKNTYNWDVRKSLPKGGLEARGDFKGDGHIEVARVLERKKRKHCAGVLTALSGRHVVQRMYEGFQGFCAKGPGADFYVAAEPPSQNIKVIFCNSAAYCTKDGFLRLVRPGFRYGYYKMYESIVFWDDRTRSWASATIAE